MKPTTRPALGSYAVAVAVTAAAVAARFLLDPLLGDHLPYATFFAAVAVATWAGGLRPALVATALGLATSLYLFVPPRRSLAVPADEHLVGLGIYLLTSLVIAGFGEAMRAAQSRFEAAARVIAEQGAAARQLAAIVGSSDDAIISKSLDGVIRSWNAAAERLFGYTAEQAVGRHITLLIPADRIDEEDRILARLRVGERVEHFDTVRVRRDGRPVPVSLTVSPIKDDEGRVVGASKIARDITDRKQAEAAAAQRLRHAALDAEVGLALGGGDTLRGMLQACAESLVRNLDGALARIWVMGEAQGALELQASAGLDTRVPLGRPEAGLVAEGRKPYVTNAVLGDPRVPEQEWARREGLAAFAGYPMLVNDRLVGVAALFARQPLGEAAVAALASAARGIALGVARKEMEGQLRQLVADLSEADRRKNEFLAMLAHELRNPLAPLRNALQVLRLGGGQAAGAEEALARMERQLGQLVRLVDDLMDISRISRGKIELRRQPVALAAVVASAVETSRPLIEQMGHELTVSLPPPVLLDADPVRLAQVLTNLLNNAAKYSERGGRIWLTASVEDGGGGSSGPACPQVVVSVRDTGVGLAADQLGRVFGLFTQVDGSLGKAQGGLGIGLSLVKSLVELHGGRVEARSDGVGTGAEFLVRLPLSAGEGGGGSEATAGAEPPAPPADHMPRARRRVLIVDDNRDGADSMAELLRLLGHEAWTAYDGQEGVSAAGEARPDVILLDIGLPKLNGYEACRRIREQPWGKDLVLVAVTGWGQDEDRRRSAEAGFDRHLVKPVDPDELMKLLAGLPAAGPG